MDALTGGVGRSFTIALACGALAILFDFTATHIPSPLPEVTAQLSGAVPPQVRKQLLSYFLVSVPASLLITLSAYAVPAIGQYANPATLLLYGRPRLRPTLWPVAYLVGRANPLWTAQTLALAFGTAAFALGLWMDDRDRGQLLTVVMLGMLGAWSVLAIFRFVYWVLRMRIPDQAIAETRTLALHLLRYVASWRGLGRASTEGALRYQRQIEIAALVDALTQAALRTRVERQPATLLAIDALRDVAIKAVGPPTLPARWYEVNAPGSGRAAASGVIPDTSRVLWLERRVIEALGSVMIDAARGHDGTTALRAAERILEIATQVVDRERVEHRGGIAVVRDQDEVLVQWCIDQYRLAFLACLDVGEFGVRHELVLQLEELIGYILASKTRRPPRTRPLVAGADNVDARHISPWTETAPRLFGSLLGPITGPCAERNDAGATQTVLAMLERIADVQLPSRGARGRIALRRLRPQALTVGIQLLAVAIAARAYAAGAAVLDWLAARGQDAGTRGLTDADRSELRDRVLGVGAASRPSGIYAEGLVALGDVRHAFLFAAAVGALGPWEAVSAQAAEIAAGADLTLLERELERLLAGAPQARLGELMDRLRSPD